MKRWVAFFMAAAMLLTCCACGQTEVSKAKTSSENLGTSFAQPTASERIQIRTWWPSANITDEQIAEEVCQIAEAGFGGIELIGISEGFNSAQIDASIYGWSTEAWNHAVNTLMSEAAKYGMSVDLTIGPRWPAGVPGLDLNSDAAYKKLETTAVHTNVLSATEAVFELPVKAATSYEAELVALVAARTEGTLNKPERTVTASKPGPNSAVKSADEFGLYAHTLTLIPEENIDLTAGTFTFAPSMAGEWSFFAFWSVPTGQTSGSTSPTAYVVDHFSLAGTEAILNYWEQNMVTPELKTYWQQYGGDMFEDSLELTSCDIPWSSDMAAVFYENYGYDLRLRLPLVMSRLTTGTLGEMYNTLDEPALAGEVFSDYTNNLNDMYIENHIKPIERWCASYNINYRAQAQGTSDNGWVDTIEAAAWLDVVEGETLGMASSPDAWRSLAGAANMGGTGVVSVELGAEGGALYQISWQRLNELVNRAAMAGANSFVLHGFASSAQQSSSNYWPGWMPFDFPLFSEAWGSRQPAWSGMTGFTDYVSRLQTVLQYGTASVDFAVYRNDMGIRTDEGYTQGVLYLNEQNLPGENFAVMQGYSYNYISPGNFTLDTAYVSDNVLNPEYAGYKALVVNNETTMNLADAQTIWGYARSGLPIVLVGLTPTTDGTAAAKDDATVVALFEELKTMANVSSVADASQLPAALYALGVAPSVEYAEPVTLASQHRHSDSGDIYYLYNYTGSYDYGSNDVYYSEDASITVDVTLHGSGQPYRLEPWTGEITAIGSYVDNGDGTLTLTLTVGDGEACILAITEDASLFADAQKEKTLVLSEPVALDSGWELTVTSYQPGINATSDYEVYDPADMELVSMDMIRLDQLKAWNEMEELTGVSGVGRYETEFRLSGGMDGAILDLGDVYDSILEVKINGHVISGINQISHQLDLGRYVKGGKNTLVVTTATTLAAAVRTFGSYTSRSDAISTYPTVYGLLGNVTVIPYVEE